jgi:CDP-4-dehydro-6-deoxyglucose reductase
VPKADVETENRLFDAAQGPEPRDVAAPEMALGEILHEASLRRAWYANERTKHFEFETSDDFDYKAGQYISMDVRLEGQQCVRSYSIASSPHHDNRFDLCLNIIPRGLVSPWLFHLKPGDKIQFTGPYGLFCVREPLDPVSAFIASGTGISPIRAMLQYLHQPSNLAHLSGKEIWLIFGVREEADILYRREFEHIARENPGFYFVPTLSRPGADWSGHRGYVQKQAARYLAGKPGFHAYICGLKKMVDDVRRRLEDLGYDPTALSCEKYD